MMRVISLKHFSSTVLTLLLELVLIRVAQCSYNADSLYRVHYFDDYIASDSAMTPPVSVHTKGQCAIQCLHDTKCQSFFYHEGYGHCWIRTKLACSSDQVKYGKGIRYYVKESKVSELCPEGPYAGAVVHTCTCFSFHVTQPLPWSLAYDACLQGSRTLAVLNTSGKATYVFLLLLTGLPTDKGYYVDATRVDNTTFQWSSGEAVLDPLWPPGEPDVSNADKTVVAIIFNSFEYYGAMAVDEVTPRYYICQRPYYVP